MVSAAPPRRWRLSPAAAEISDAVMAHYERLAAAHVPPELAADLARAYQAALLAARAHELVYQDT
ncbi:MAG TPA: hypothetical protein PKD53_00560 [Chloroflexaceae bacterium]|nr:hypothetical protein [Chloroflexaceae bacterium]